MVPVVYVNGKISDSRDASVPVFDHGFLYGEGVYETMRTYWQQLFLFDRHMDRLRRPAALMALAVPFSDFDLLERVQATMEAGRSPARAAGRATPDEAYVRVILTRGVGELSYSLAACPTPTLVIIAKPFAGLPDHTFRDGIAIALVNVRRNVLCWRSQ